MKGKYEIIVQNARLQYKFTLYRNITILKGNSATGKTTLIEMIAAYQLNGENSGVTIRSAKQCVVLTSNNWKLNLGAIHDSVVFIDEGDIFVKSVDFARAIKNSDNYYVIATRANLSTLPYSVTEIYGIKNTSGNKYQQTKRLYSRFYPINKIKTETINKPELVIVEDSNSGYEFFSDIFSEYHIQCISAYGKSNIFNLLKERKEKAILVIADGAAYGSEIERVLQFKNTNKPDIMLFFPESFEWIILKSGIIADVKDIIDKPYDYVESKENFSWEIFFNKLLSNKTKGTYLNYDKEHLNSNYLHDKEKQLIISAMPEMNLE